MTSLKNSAHSVTAFSFLCNLGVEASFASSILTRVNNSRICVLSSCWYVWSVSSLVAMLTKSSTSLATNSIKSICWYIPNVYRPLTCSNGNVTYTREKWIFESFRTKLFNKNDKWRQSMTINHHRNSMTKSIMGR